MKLAFYVSWCNKSSTHSVRELFLKRNFNICQDSTLRWFWQINRKEYIKQNAIAMILSMTYYGCILLDYFLRDFYSLRTMQLIFVSYIDIGKYVLAIIEYTGYSNAYTIITVFYIQSFYYRVRMYFFAIFLTIFGIVFANYTFTSIYFYVCIFKYYI